MADGILQADVCIVCALEEEADAVEQEVCERCKTAFAAGTTNDGRFVYRYTTITNNKHEQLTLLLLRQTRPGPVFLALDLRSLLQMIQPRFVAMSGICAGDKRHLQLGDLVVAEYAYHFEEGKATRDEIGALVHEPEGITYGPAERVLQYIRTFEAWKAPILELRKHFFNVDELPRRIMALMASGMAVRSDDPFESLQKQHRKTWALDMEAATFYLALRAFPGIDGLVVKGVADYADLTKDDTFHDFAARASALYLLTFIQEYVTVATPFPLPPQTVRRDWGEAPDVPIFFGRTKELISLGQWIIEDRCRLVALVGMKGIGKTRLSVKLGRGGIGKTDLSLKLARGIEAQFDYVIWRRLLNAPRVSELLTDVIKFLSNQQEVTLPDTVSEQISRLLHYLRQFRCLMILDNAEMILQAGQYVNQYLSGYEEYGQLFGRIADVPHQSCLLLTSREKPPEIASRERKAGPVRSLELRGLNVADGKKIFAEIGTFSGSKEGWKRLNSLYNGNPLALELAARHIQEVFFGSVSEFLREGKPIFTDLRSLLDWHFNRLSDSHKEVMYWLAINREPTVLSELKEDILSFVGKEQISSTLSSLQRLIPLEKSAQSFTLQPILIEYMTERFTEQIVEEIRNGEIKLFNTHALLKTSASDYVRDIQYRLILKPVSEKILEIYKTRERLEGRLREILSLLRERFRTLSGYAGGNLLNLLCYLKVNLRGYNFSFLAVWQAYLQGVDMQEVNLAHANLANVVFTDTFGKAVSVAFSSQGDLIAAGTATGGIRLWYANGTPLRTIQRHGDWVRPLAFSPDGKILASGSHDPTIRLWEVSSGQCLKILQGHTTVVYSVAFSPDGKTLASGSEDHMVRLWDTRNGQCLKILQGHTDPIYSIAFSPDGKTLASGSFDDVNWATFTPGGGPVAPGNRINTMLLWEVSTGQCLKSFPGHINGITSLAFSPDGSTIVTGSNDQMVRLWDIKSDQCLKTLLGHTKGGWSVAFSADQSTIASGSLDGTIRLWEASTGQCLHTLIGDNNWVWSVVFSPDGKTLGSASERTVRLWDTRNDQCLRTLQGYGNQVESVAFSPDGNTIVSGHEDSTVCLWEMSSGVCLKILHGHTNRVESIAFSPDGKFLASGSWDQTVRLWEMSSGVCFKILYGHPDAVRSIAFSPDGKLLASGSSDRSIRLWEISSGLCLKAFQGHTDRVTSIAFSPDGNTIISGSWDQDVRLWEVSSGRCLKILQGHTSSVWSVAFSLDGKILASASDDQTVRLWEASSGTCLKILQGHSDYVRCVIFGPDEGTLVSGSWDQTVRLWEASSSWKENSGARLQILESYTRIALSPDGRTLVSGSFDGTIKLWDMPTGQYLQTLRNDKPYERMNITQVKGLTEAQKATLRSLGAIEDEEQKLI